RSSRERVCRKVGSSRSRASRFSDGFYAPAAPRAWISEDRAPDAAALVARLANAFSTTGLWPLVLESLNDDADERPWLAAELSPAPYRVSSTRDAQETLANWWSDVFPTEDEVFDDFKPFSREFPGLAAAPPAGRDSVPIHEVAAVLSGRLALVPLTRPADAPAALGWTGPINHYGDMGLLSCVLRSWEERFEAFVVGIGFDTLTLAVGRPPSTLDAARSVAAEHFATCPDTVYQGCGSIEALAQDLLDSETWTFWWD
ncbi:MAG TPA: DUF4253 domain-containing protein, partial [Polyangiaceae bacterium]|nr:DUF4253 domain-containing protein [Polyangiaceae bacterium]